MTTAAVVRVPFEMPPQNTIPACSIVNDGSQAGKEGGEEAASESMVRVTVVPGNSGEFICTTTELDRKPWPLPKGRARAIEKDPVKTCCRKATDVEKSGGVGARLSCS